MMEYKDITLLDKYDSIAYAAEDQSSWWVMVNSDELAAPPYDSFAGGDYFFLRHVCSGKREQHWYKPAIHDHQILRCQNCSKSCPPDVFAVWVLLGENDGRG